MLGDGLMKRRSFFYLLFALATLLGAVAYRFRHPILGRLKPGNRTVDEVLGQTANEATAEIADGSPLALLAFKQEQQLELWKSADGAWTRVRRWPFTATSGTLGPKLREGDRQIPEGQYRIEYLNPNSSYHLSMKVDYPNAFDRQHAAAAGRTNLGGDIFIHGKDQTIGCIPIGDAAIEELFAIVAANGKDTVEVLIAPRDLRLHPPPNSAELPVLEELPWTKALYEQLRLSLERFPVSV